LIARKKTECRKSRATVPLSLHLDIYSKATL
jgi:hypothetical protein